MHVRKQGKLQTTRKSGLPSLLRLLCFLLFSKEITVDICFHCSVATTNKLYFLHCNLFELLRDKPATPNSKHKNNILMRFKLIKRILQRDPIEEERKQSRSHAVRHTYMCGLKSSLFFFIHSVIHAPIRLCLVHGQN